MLKKLKAFHSVHGPSAYRVGHYAAVNKRRNNRLAYFGSLLVIVTYVTKDEFHERWKDKSTAIDNALSAYSIRQSNRELREQVDRMGDHVSRILGIATNRGDAFREWHDGDDLRFERSMIDYMQADVKNLSTVVDELPSNSESIKSLAYIKKQVTEQNALEEKIEGHAGGDDTVGSLAKGDESVAGDVSATADEIAEDAEKFKQRAKRNERYANIASVFFYVLGTGLSLYGKLSGQEVEGAEAN